MSISSKSSERRFQQEVQSIGGEWYKGVLVGLSSLKRDISHEELQKQYSKQIQLSQHFYQCLMGVARTLERTQDDYRTFSSTSGSQADAESNAESVTSDSITADFVSHLNKTRYAAFSDRCLCMASPRREPINKPLHDMIFQPSDCFLELNTVYPGSHGWVFVFREELQDWLLATPNFHLSYQTPNGNRIYYGAYHASLLPGCDLAGVEFLRLDHKVQEHIIEVLTKRPPGSENYVLMYNDIVSAKKTFPCILLQCIQSALPSTDVTATNMLVGDSIPQLMGNSTVPANYDGIHPGQYPLAQEQNWLRHIPESHASIPGHMAHQVQDPANFLLLNVKTTPQKPSKSTNATSSGQRAAQPVAPSTVSGGGNETRLAMLSLPNTGPNPNLVPVALPYTNRWCTVDGTCPPANGAGHLNPSLPPMCRYQGQIKTSQTQAPPQIVGRPVLASIPNQISSVTQPGAYHLAGFSMPRSNNISPTSQAQENSYLPFPQPQNYFSNATQDQKVNPKQIGDDHGHMTLRSGLSGQNHRGARGRLH